MHAIGFERVGGPEVLRSVEVPDPRPGPGQVLVRVAYAGVNFAEVVARRGGLAAPEGLTIPGLEVSGHVLEVGGGVEGLAAGDRVAALTHPRVARTGGYAELAVAPAELVYRLDDGLDLLQAAALGCTATTAYGLLSISSRGPGETVLVHGAAGGVGSLAVQIARLLGARTVIGTVGSAAKLEAARRAGCDRVYTRDEYAVCVREAIGERSIDVVLDSVAGAGSEAALNLLAPLGRLAAFGNAGGDDDLLVSIHRLWFEARAVLGYNIGELAERAPNVLRLQALAARDLLASGRVRVEITDVAPLAAAADVHRRLESGRSQGKFVLEVA